MKKYKTSMGKEFYLTWSECSKVAIKNDIESSSDYKSRYNKIDIRLPYNPDLFYKDFPGWHIFLDKEKKKFFPTWQKANKVCIMEKVRSQEDYNSRYKEIDSRLPSSPNSFYKDFPGWAVFLGGEKKKLFPTWKKASKACIKAGLKSRGLYRTCHKQIDSRLPASPEKVYKDFPGWAVFLGGEKKKLFPTWKKASKVCINAKINGSEDYNFRYYQISSRLPASPRIAYKDFPGWSVFLGRRIGKIYETWQKASKVCINFEVKNQIDYFSRYKKIDTQLPRNPDSFYKDFPGWSIFLNHSRWIRETSFMNFFRTDKVIRSVVEAFNGNEVDIINVLSIISSGKWSRKKMERWMRRPRLSKWIGKFKKPSFDPKAILEASFKLMPYDKNGMISKLLLDCLIKWSDERNGPNPTKEKKLQTIKELQVYVRKLNAA